MINYTPVKSIEDVVVGDRHFILFNGHIFSAKILSIETDSSVKVEFELLGKPFSCKLPLGFIYDKIPNWNENE